MLPETWPSLRPSVGRGPRPDHHPRWPDGRRLQRQRGPFPRRRSTTAGENSIQKPARKFLQRCIASQPLLCELPVLREPSSWLGSPADQVQAFMRVPPSYEEEAALRACRIPSQGTARRSWDRHLSEVDKNLKFLRLAGSDRSVPVPSTRQATDLRLRIPRNSCAENPPSPLASPHAMAARHGTRRLPRSSPPADGSVARAGTVQARARHRGPTGRGHPRAGRARSVELLREQLSRARRSSAGRERCPP